MWLECHPAGCRSTFSVYLAVTCLLWYICTLLTGITGTSRWLMEKNQLKRIMKNEAYKRSLSNLLKTHKHTLIHWLAVACRNQAVHPKALSTITSFDFFKVTGF